MKSKTVKLIATFVLLLGLFIASAFASGDYPIGNRSCGGEGQQPCPTPTPLYEQQPTDDPIMNAVKDFLKYIFG